MPGDINRQNLVTGGTEGSHQHTRTEGSAFSHIDFYKIQNSSEDTCLDGQQSSFGLPGKDRGRGGAHTHNKDPLGLSKYGVICSQKRSQLLQSTYQVI